jgi:glycosyltransferase involved in cell wall biosynthesis
MRILVLAPHPYHIVRGTSIDLDLLLRVLCARPGTQVDLVCYADGADPGYANLRIHRIAGPAWTRGTKPGFSLRKLACDLLLARSAWSLLRRERYDVIHADEEAAFLAILFQRLYGVPYVYDLDSSVAQQLVEKYAWLRPLSRLLDALEAAAIRRALATAPVCNALADLCRSRGSAKVVTLHDISQLARPDAPRTGKLAAEVSSSRLFLLYAGNLESYQGIDLLLDSFALAAQRSQRMDLVVIGGDPDDIARYRARAAALGLEGRAHFIGPRPLEVLDGYLAEADVLVAPRIRGVNTPMKVFPYLHSGRPVLVTDLPTHSQILTPEVAMLAPPEPEGFAQAILRLVDDAELRARLGARGRAFAEANHTFPAHARRVNDLYDFVESRLADARR